VGQFKLGPAKRGRQAFEPVQFGFHALANRETGVWLQTLGWIMERNNTLLRSDRQALRSFLAAYHRDSEHNTILSVTGPFKLILVGPAWPRGQGPKLILPSSLGAVDTALQTLSDRDRSARKGPESPGIDRPTPIRDHSPPAARTQSIHYSPAKHQHAKI